MASLGDTLTETSQQWQEVSHRGYLGLLEALGWQIQSLFTTQELISL